MSLIKRLLDSISGHMVMHVALGEHGAVLTFRQGGRVIDPLSQAIDRLPDIVASLLLDLSDSAIADNQGQPPDFAFTVPFEVARRLVSALDRAGNLQMSIEADALRDLTIVAMRPGFAIYWALDARTARLVRMLSGAEQSLGEGWYRYEKAIWRLPLGEMAPEARSLLSEPDLRGAQIVRLLSDVLPTARRLGLPFRCDLALAPRGAIRVDVVDADPRALTIRFDYAQAPPSPPPAPLPDDPTTLISGMMVYPGLGAFRPRRLAQLNAGESVRLTGDEILTFMVVCVASSADRYGLDQAALNRIYPVTEFLSMRPAWALEQSVVRGVGSVSAAVRFSLGEESIRRSVAWAHAQNTPHLMQGQGAAAARPESPLRPSDAYLRATKGWVRLPDSMGAVMARIDQRFGPDFALTPNELLGVRSARVVATKLRVPAPRSAPAQDANEAFAALDALRLTGLPAGLYGFADSTTQILIGLIQRICAEYSAARIFWLLPLKNQKPTRAALEAARIHTVEANRPADFAAPSTVYLSDNYFAGSAGGSWTLTIFQDIETVLSATFAASSVRFARDWVVFTAAADPSSFRRDMVQFLLHALGISPDVSAVFYKACIVGPNRAIQSSTERKAGGRQPQAGAFTTLTLGAEGGAKPAAGLPIPIPDGVTRGLPQNFAAEARRFADRVETSGVPVPLNTLLPAYNALLPDQERWYFTWRARLRAGEWLPAEIGYVLLLSFELISLVGVADAPEAYRMLRTLWERYRAALPALDERLPHWIADLSAMNRLSPAPLVWYAEAAAAGVSIGALDLLVAAWREAGRPVAELPMSAILDIAGYAPANSRFYSENDPAGVQKIHVAFRASLGAIDGALRAASPGGGLLAPAEGAQRVRFMRVPFLGARHSYPHQPILIAEYAAVPLDGRISTWFGAILRQTENMLRAQAGFRGKLRVGELPPGWADLIEKAQEALRPQRRVALDLSKIQRLHEESAEVREMLTVDDDPALDARDPIAAIRAPAAPPTTLPEADFIARTPTGPPLTAPEEPEPDPAEAIEPPWDAFAERLRPIDWSILRLILRAQDGRDAGDADDAKQAIAGIAEVARAARTFPNLLLEALNETALETTNELILDTITDEESPSLYEEAVDPVRALLAWADRHPPTGQGTP